MISTNRYFDLRVNYVPNEDPDQEFWLVHNFIYVKPSLLEILNEIKLFLTHRPEEFIILDFHEVTSYPQVASRVRSNKQTEQEAHFKLIQYLMEHLKGLIVPNTVSLTIDEMYSRPERIIITYYDQKVIETMFEKETDESKEKQLASIRQKYANISFFAMVKNTHPNVAHIWANQDNLIDLLSFMHKSIQVINSTHLKSLKTIEALDLSTSNKFKSQIQNSKSTNHRQLNFYNRLFAQMIQMTPKMMKILAFGYRGGLNSMAETVNDVIHELLWKQHQCINIIASDFVLGNNVVQLTKQFNKLRDTSGQTKCIHNFNLLN